MNCNCEKTFLFVRIDIPMNQLSLLFFVFVLFCFMVRKIVFCFTSISFSSLTYMLKIYDF